MLTIISLSSNAIGSLKWKRKVPYETAGCAATLEERLLQATRGGILYCFNSLGTVLWSKDLKEGLLSSPVALNGRIYLAGEDGSFYCFSSQGKDIFHKVFECSFRVSPLPVSQSEMLLFSDKGEILLVNPENGELLSQQKVEAEFFAPAVLNAGRRIVVIPNKNGALLALTPGGKPLWKFSNRGVNFGCPALTTERIYFSSMDHFLYALDYDGRLVWEFQSERWNLSSPVVDEKGVIYFGSYDQHFYAVRPDGRLLWKKRLLSAVNATALIDDRGNLLLGDSAGFVYQFDQTGTTIFSMKTPDFIRSPLTIITQSLTAMAFSIDGTLFGFAHDAPLSRKAPWPKYQKDLANTAGFNR